MSIENSFEEFSCKREQSNRGVVRRHEIEMLLKVKEINNSMFACHWE